METLTTLREFLGWCTVLNFGLLLFATVMLSAFRGFAMSIHAKLTGVDEAELPRAYFDYLANYKLGVLLLNAAPYAALVIMD